MQTLTEKVFKLSPPFGLFDGIVVRNLFPDSTEGSRKLLINRAVKAREVLRLKRGLFILAQEYRETTPHPYTVAALLHAPSHISFETALAFHGLIPEAVYQVASVTTSRSREFDTPLGYFTFYRVPLANPRSGVESIKLDEASWVFIATPLRAIVDLLYLRDEVSWDEHGLEFLTESLRIDADDLQTLDFTWYPEIVDGLRNKRVTTFLIEMKKVLEL